MRLAPVAWIPLRIDGPDPTPVCPEHTRCRPTVIEVTEETALSGLVSAPPSPPRPVPWGDRQRASPLSLPEATLTELHTYPYSS